MEETKGTQLTCSNLLIGSNAQDAVVLVGAQSTNMWGIPSLTRKNPILEWRVLVKYQGIYYLLCKDFDQLG